MSSVSWQLKETLLVSKSDAENLWRYSSPRRLNVEVKKRSIRLTTETDWQLLECQDGKVDISRAWKMLERTLPFYPNKVLLTLLHTAAT